jgi:hypothetical protein
LCVDTPMWRMFINIHSNLCLGGPGHDIKDTSMQFVGM